MIYFKKCYKINSNAWEAVSKIIFSNNFFYVFAEKNLI